MLGYTSILALPLFFAKALRNRYLADALSVLRTWKTPPKELNRSCPQFQHAQINFKVRACSPIAAIRDTYTRRPSLPSRALSTHYHNIHANLTPIMHVHTPFLTRCLLQGALSISCLLATFGQAVDAYPQTTNINSGLNGNASVNAMPPLFRHLAIVYGAPTQDRTYDPLSPVFHILGLRNRKGNADPEKTSCVDFSRADVALTFISAMAQESLEPWNDRLFHFDYIDPDTPVRIVLQSAPTARTATTVRSTAMWVLQQVPIDLLRTPTTRGFEFKVQANGQDLYIGKVSSRNRPAAAGVLAHSGVQGRNSSSGSSEQNRKGPLLINQPSNTSIESLNLTDQLLADDRYVAIYEFAGLPFRDIDMFSFILKYIFQLAAEDDVHEAISFAYFAPSTSPIWSYARQHAGQSPTQIVHVYHVVMMLLGAARYCVEQGVYGELLIELWMNEALLVAGCVVRGLDGRQWCRGLVPRGTGAPAQSLDFS